MSYQIPEVKPKMKASGGALDSSDQQPAFAYDNGNDIIMFSEQSWFGIIRGWLKTAFFLVLSAAGLFAVLYIVLAATLLFVTVSNGTSTTVVRGTFLGGIPDKGMVIMASQSEIAATDPVNRLKTGLMGVPDNMIVEVLSGSQDTITFDGRTITANGVENQKFEGRLFDVTGEELGQMNAPLSGQLLTKCLGGDACTPGDFMIVDLKTVQGEVKEINIPFLKTGQYNV